MPTQLFTIRLPWVRLVIQVDRPAPQPARPVAAHHRPDAVPHTPPTAAATLWERLTWGQLRRYR